MPCSVSGCKADPVVEGSLWGADRTVHGFLLCDKHTPDVLPKAAPAPAATGTEASVVGDKIIPAVPAAKAKAK